VRISYPKTDPLLSASMRQASFKCETPRLELKSSRSFLAIKRCQWTKIGKVIKLARSSKKSGRISATIAVKLLSCVMFWTMDMMVFMINDFPVPPHPITVARIGLYFVLLFRNFTIVSIDASTTACCCSDRSLSKYSDQFFVCGYLKGLANLDITLVLFCDLINIFLSIDGCISILFEISD
jgi:hypothetical protein